MRPAELQMFLDERDMTQKALAELLGVTPQTPMRWLAGSWPVPITTGLLLRLLEGNHVSLARVAEMRRLYEPD